MYYFIINEAGGRGRAGEKWRAIRRELLTKNVAHAAWMTHAKGEAMALARLVSAQKETDKRIVVLGGDGTINEVINGITDFESVALGVVPIGSGNDFARGLGMPKRPEHAMYQIFHSKGDTRLDLGEVKMDQHAPRRFGISAGVGMDAKVCQMVEASLSKSVLNRVNLGHLSYALLTLRAVLEMESARGVAIFERENDTVTRVFDQLTFLAAMNFRAEGGGVPIAPKASAHDGLLSACMAKDFTTSSALRMLPALGLGKHVGKKGVSVTEVKKVALHLETPLVVHADGEMLGSAHDISFEVLPKALRVLV